MLQRQTIVLSLLEIMSTPQEDFDYAVKVYLEKGKSITWEDYILLTFLAIHGVEVEDSQPVAYPIRDLGKGAELAEKKIELAIKNYQN